MDSEIIISINLPGQLGPLVKHTTKQNHSAIITGKNGRPEAIIRRILHTDRGRTTCIKEIRISPLVVNNWLKGPCPSWILLKNWKKYSDEMKIASFVETFDEGFGVKYE